MPRPAVVLRAPSRDRSRLAVGIDLRPLADPHFRGFGRYTYEITKALAARPDLDVTGFTDCDLAHETSVRTVRYAGQREIVREQCLLPRLLAREQIDVFLCPANRGLPFAAPCATVLTLHDVVEWDRALFRQGRGKAHLRFIYASVASLAGSSLILTVSRSAAQAIEQRLGVAPRRVRHVYEAANAQFNPTPVADDAARRDSLGIKRKYILYVGGFDQKKDLRTLVHSLALLQDHPEVDLVIAGELSPEADHLVQAANELHVRYRLHLLGYVPDKSLPALYRGAQCLVFPALAEGFGLPVVEAMACGTPVVAAAAGSLPEVIADGGQLVKPRDPIALSSVMRQLLSDKSNRDQWACAAKVRAAAFSWERTGQLTEDVLREAAAEPLFRAWALRVARLPRAIAQCVFTESFRD